MLKRWIEIINVILYLVTELFNMIGLIFLVIIILMPFCLFSESFWKKSKLSLVGLK